MSVRAPVGDVNLTRKTIVIGRGLAAIQPYGYSLEYLYHFLLTQKSILEQQATGTTFKSNWWGSIEEFANSFTC